MSGALQWDLYLYDLRSEREERITQDTTLGRGPAISGRRVVWGDIREGDAALFEYIVDTGSESGPHGTAIVGNGLALSGDHAAWSNTDDDIYVYDFLAAAERRVTKLPERQWFPDLSGPNLVWEDHRSGEEEIYFATIPELFE